MINSDYASNYKLLDNVYAFPKLKLIHVSKWLQELCGKKNIKLVINNIEVTLVIY